MQQLQLSKDQVKYLCEEASRAATQGQRAEIFACEVARASAGELLLANHCRCGILLCLCCTVPQASLSKVALAAFFDAYCSVVNTTHLYLSCNWMLRICCALKSCLSPALEDRRVSAEDLKLAVKLAIAPRGIFMQTPPDDEEMMVRSVTA